MATKKIFTVKTTCPRHNGSDSVSTKTGTLEELIGHFSYTLEIGNSWNKKISLAPKTIKSFVSNLQAAYEEKEASCYNRTTVDLVTE
jgi:hypothetical protein